ncbi:MAG: hypothetical protein EA001_00390 [Oscillatoriales cyanobacterium]|nr:MAG: hypothetical protein EA001_00390 [Oscillatoriales cyanobacterium]
MVTVCAVPREQLENLNLAQFVEREGYEIPRSRLSAAAWSLENPQVDALMQKIRSVGVPLVDFAGTKPGIKTGFNEAFLIDDQTRQKLIAEDPKCSEIIKPIAKGQDIKRWHPSIQNQWIIFARRGIEIELYPGILRHLQQYQKSLEPCPRDWKSTESKKWQGRKSGSYKWYEIQDSVDYWKFFEHPKIVNTDIMWRSQFSFDRNNLYLLNTSYFIPVSNQYLISVLNSPILWSFMWRNLQHGKDEALRLFGQDVVSLPIAPPAEPIRREAWVGSPLNSTSKNPARNSPTLPNSASTNFAPN